MSDTMVPRLLVIEDDPDAAALMVEMLQDHFGSGCVQFVDNVTDARAVDLSIVDLVLSDLNLPDGNGLDLVDQFLKQRSDLPIVMVTSETGLDIATDAIRRGAYDYIVKTGEYIFTIPLVVEKNLEIWKVKQENHRLQHELQQTLNQVQVKNNQLEEAVAELERQALTDPLTGLSNRRYVQEILERSFAEANRYGSDLACVMIDLDGFKALNDTLGHQKGDELLKTTARVLKANCRRSDVAGRYGGDEFVLLLPHTDIQVAQHAARRIQEQFLETTQYLHEQGGPTCNMSIGIASVSVAKPANADQLVALADAALYRAKQAGKACIHVHTAVSAPVADNHVMTAKSA